MNILNINNTDPKIEKRKLEQEWEKFISGNNTQLQKSALLCMILGNVVWNKECIERK